jgi:hypothetical protein
MIGEELLGEELRSCRSSGVAECETFGSQIAVTTNFTDVNRRSESDNRATVFPKPHPKICVHL